MGPLAAVERFLERLFERQTARLFKTAIRPIQVQRRVERAMEAGRVRDGQRTLVPHRITIRLAAQDMTAIRASAPRLAADLADAALAFARAHGYSLAQRPVVLLAIDAAVQLGDVAVDAVPPDHQAPADPDVPSLESETGPGHAGGSDHTAVFVVPDVDGPRATILEIRPDRTTGTVEMQGRPVTIGRASDNGLVLRDSRASRHHARIDSRRGSLVLTDLGSTNGSWVNDRRVESVALGEGDRIRIGTTTLVIEAVTGGAGTTDEAGMAPTG